MPDADRPPAPAPPQPGTPTPGGPPFAGVGEPGALSFAGRPPRAGQLTTAWQIMVAITWAAAFFAFAAVWKASEEIGISTWWLGPRADPQPTIVQIIPFVIAVAIALTAIYNVRVVPWLSLAGAGAIALIAAFDLSHQTGLAFAEFVIAGAVAMVSLASFGGRYRRPDPATVGADPQPEGRPGPWPSPTPPFPAGPPTAG